jgi:NAD-dependent DNA ligase
MELTDINGVGESTAKKLIKNGYKTIEDLQSATLEDLTGIGIHENTAEKIVGSIAGVPQKPEIADIEYDIKNANKFVLYAFRESEDYDENNPKESFDKWYRKVLVANEKLKEE